MADDNLLRSAVLTVLTEDGLNDYPIAMDIARAVAAALQVEPIDMVLHCPACGMQHIDAPSFTAACEPCKPPAWTNPPHRSHQCQHCKDKNCRPFVWRPADVPTNGVEAVKTRGRGDSPIVTKDAVRPCPPLTRDHAEWVADKIVALGDYAKEAAWMLRQWPTSPQPAVPASEPAYMPILGTPFAVLMSSLNEAQAKANHSQSLRKLAERGGLSMSEAAAVAKGEAWKNRDTKDAVQALLAVRTQAEQRSTD